MNNKTEIKLLEKINIKNNKPKIIPTVFFI